SRSRRSGLGDKMANRVLQPLASRVAAEVDLDHQRQPGKEEPICMLLAAEIAADKPGRLAAPTQSHRLWCKQPAPESVLCCTVETSSLEHGIPHCRRKSTLDTQTSQSELSLADAMHQFDTGDRNRRGREAREA